MTDEPGVVEHFAAMARDNHQFVKSNMIGLNERGDPSREDLRLSR